MSHYLIEQIAALPNVDVRTGTRGGGRRGRRTAPARADASAAPTARSAARTSTRCFVFIGATPRTDWLEGVVARDERGFILAGPDARGRGLAAGARPLRCWRPACPGVFVAGDVRARSIKRVASAVGEGSMAVSLIHRVPGRGMSATTSRRRPAPRRPLRRARRRAARALGRGRRAARRGPPATSSHEQGGAPRGLLLLLEGDGRTVLVAPDGREEPVGRQRRADLDGGDRRR